MISDKARLYKTLGKLNKSSYQHIKKLNKKQKSQVNKIVLRKFELKRADFSSSANQGFNNAGIFSDITTLSVGVAVSNRVGDQVMPRRISIRWNVECQLTNPYQVFRILIVQYRLDNTAGTPTLGNFLDTSVGGVVTVYSDYNHDLRHQYTVLYDKMYTGQGSLGSSKYTQCGRILIGPKKMARVNYNTGVNTGDHHIYMIFFGNNTSTSTGCLLNTNARLYFKD